MNAPRFRIAWVMVTIAIAAIDFAAIRALLGSDSLVDILLLVGALPMANVLAVGLLVVRRRPENRPFLLGFETFGAMALALHVALICDPNETALGAYLALLNEPLKTIGHRFPAVLKPSYLVAVVMFGWPQVSFALVGGLLSRSFKITITRRR